MLSKSHNLNTSGGIASGPAAFPIFNEDFTFLSSSIVNRPSLISRSSKMFGISSSRSSSANPFVKKVEVLHSTPVACFIGASDLEEKLGDFTDEIELANTDYVKKLCALLAQAKAYKLFALGMDGLCLSAADMENKYYVGGTNGANL